MTDDNGRGYVPETKWSFKKTFICDWDWWLYNLFRGKRRNKLNVRENIIHNVEDVGVSEALYKDSDESGRPDAS